MNRLSEKLSSYFKLAENNTTVRTEVLAGITSFITIIGLKNSGLVVSNEATLVSLADFSQWRTPGADISGLCGALVTLIGLITIGILHIKKVRGSIFLGIIVATIVFMPFTYSIANGIALGLITHCLILLLTGKGREVKPLTIIVSLIFIARYAFITLG